MSNTEKQSIGTVAYNDANFMPIARVVHGSEVSLTSLENCVPNDRKNMWAYLIVGYEESKEIRSSSKDDDELLKKIKNKYALTIESAINANVGKLGQQVFPFENKLIAIEQSLLKPIGDLKSLLKSESYLCQANELKESNPLAVESRMYLQLSTEIANSHLQNEHNHIHHTKKEELHKVHAYAFVGMPYTYNEEELEINSEAVFVSLMPKVQFEAGVFFDGTLNNLYNTALRVDFEGYTQAQSDFLNGFPSKSKFDTNAANLLLQNKPREEVLKTIQKDLKETITFFKNTQNMDDDIKTISNKETKKVSEDIYDYLEDVRESKNKHDVKTFVEKELLPDSGSFTNDESNIAILSKLYNLKIENNSHKGVMFRKSLYITGAGSYNPYLEKEHKEDALFGKAFGTNETGVLAKVDQACSFIKESLDEKKLNYVDTLVLDVFGFSRGAAEARHFVNTIADSLDLKFKNEKDEFVLYKKDGSNLYPLLIKELEEKKDAIVIDKIIFRFVGIFDTVPHHGLVQVNDGDDLNLHLNKEKISNVLHLTAKDEARGNFSLYSIKESKEQGLAKHFEEREFYGVHSDLGGGYVHNSTEMVSLSFKDEYFTSKEQTILKTKQKIISWNKKYKWIDNTVFTFWKDKKQDSFIILPFSTLRSKKKYTCSVYMHRNNISSEYSKVVLEYMHKKLIDLKHPFLKLGQYKSSDLILTSLSEKQKIFNLDEDKAKKIRSKYFHHSINIKEIGMSGNTTNEKNEFYGKRVIYGSKGGKFK